MRARLALLTFLLATPFLFGAGGGGSLVTTFSASTPGTVPATGECSNDTFLRCDGTWATVPGGGGGGISSLNGLTGGTQTFATPGTSGTAPAWSSSGTAHTLNLPMASASGVTAGLVSKTNYDAWQAKQAAITGTTQGDIAYYNGSSWTRLAPGTSGQYLQTQGSGANPQWASVSGGSGFDTIGSFGSTPNSKGASSSGTTITFQPADGSNPGMVSTGAQTIAGVKTFSSIPLGPEGTDSAGAGLNIPTWGATGVDAKTGFGISRETLGGGGDADFLFGTIRGNRAFEIWNNETTNNVEWILNDGSIRTDAATPVARRLIGINPANDASGGFLRMALGQQVAGTGTAGINTINSNRWDVTNSSGYGFSLFMNFSSNYGMKVIMPAGGTFGAWTDDSMNLGYSSSSPTTLADSRFKHAVFSNSVAVGYAGGTTGVDLGGFFSSNGTVTDPGFAFHADAEGARSGMYRISSTELGFSAGGAFAFKASSGAIGTLDNAVNDSSATTSLVVRTGAKSSGTGATGSLTLGTGTSTGGTGGDVIIDPGNGVGGAGFGGNIVFKTNGTQRARIDSNTGKLGVVATTAGSGNTSIYPIGNASSGIGLLSNGMTVESGGAEALIITWSSPNTTIKHAYNGSIYIGTNSIISAQFSPTGLVSYAAPGSAGAPSMSLLGDTDTGFYSSGANALDVSVGAANVFRWKSGVAFKNVASGAETAAGSGSADLGSNSPATTNSAPYTWLKVETSDGSTGYIPIWK